MDNFWEKNAEAWSQVMSLQGIASRQVTNKAALERIFALKPRSVLDLGCGEGFLSEPLRAQNIFYHGLDGSAELIRLARNKYGDFFETVSYENLAKWRPSRKFDLAVFNFSLFEENLAPLLQTVRKLVVPDGRVLIQTLHPSALKDDKSGWNIEDFKTMSVPFSGTMRWYGRTLLDWRNLFIESGWILATTTEPVYESKPASIIFELKP